MGVGISTGPATNQRSYGPAALKLGMASEVKAWNDQAVTGMFAYHRLNMPSEWFQAFKCRAVIGAVLIPLGSSVSQAEELDLPVLKK